MLLQVLQQREGKDRNLYVIFSSRDEYLYLSLQSLLTTPEYTQYNVIYTEKNKDGDSISLTETSQIPDFTKYGFCMQTLQRAGDGGNPVQVAVKENHS